MDIDTEIKLAKVEHEHAVLTARKLELRKQILETKKTLATLGTETQKVDERLSGVKVSIEQLLQGE